MLDNWPSSLPRRRDPAEQAPPPTTGHGPQGALPLYNAGMYIIVIGWLYVTVLMALTESSVIAGILSLTFYGLLPTALLVWLFGGPTRRRAARMARQANETNAANEANGFGETKQPHDR
jgi:hypothetical protein